MSYFESTEEALEWVSEKFGAAKKQVAPSTFTVSKKNEGLADVRAKELELWKTWNKSGKTDDLQVLLKSFNRMIQNRVNLFKNRVEVPVAAIDFEHKKMAVKAFETYDPSKGKLSTWVSQNLMRAGRFVETNKNFARISENINRHIGAFNAVKSELGEKLGHEPDDLTLHDHILSLNHPTLGMLSLKDIKRLNREQRKGLIATGREADEFKNVNQNDRFEEVKQLIWYQLTPQERSVHEYTFGLNGKPQLAPGSIAKKLKMDNSKVAKLRTSIYNKMKPHLGE